jgi:hypothetical protein
MYTIARNGRVMLDGKSVDLETLPKSRKFDTPAGPCVVVARTKQERVALANASGPEDLDGYTEALAEVRA